MNGVIISSYTWQIFLWICDDRFFFPERPRKHTRPFSGRSIAIVDQEKDRSRSTDRSWDKSTEHSQSDQPERSGLEIRQGQVSDAMVPMSGELQ